MVNRVDRVNSEIQKIISEVISEDIKDPEIDGKLISVVGVRTSTDLAYSKIFISILDTEDNKHKIFKKLKNAESFIQKCVADKLDLRKSPVITLVLDDSLERGDKIIEIIKGWKK